MSRLGNALDQICVAAACLLVLLGGTYVAPPQIIMLHGGPLPAPVFLTHVPTNERFALSLSATSSPPRDTSAVVHVGFFYAPLKWSRAARDPATLRILRASDADHVAELIVSGDRRTAVLDFGLAGTMRGVSRFRRIAPPGREILRSSGVPLLVAD